MTTITEDTSALIEEMAAQKLKMANMSDRELLEATYMMAWSTAKWQQKAAQIIEEMTEKFKDNPLMSMFS